jgi:hypothetical protein
MDDSKSRIKMAEDNGSKRTSNHKTPTLIEGSAYYEEI